MKKTRHESATTTTRNDVSVITTTTSDTIITRATPIESKGAANEKPPRASRPSIATGKKQTDEKSNEVKEKNAKPTTQIVLNRVGGYATHLHQLYTETTHD